MRLITADPAETVDAVAGHRRRSARRGIILESQMRGQRREAERAARETLCTRAKHLPAAARALVDAHFGLGMPIDELALINRQTPRQMRRRLARLRATLNDPCFILAVRFREKLPPALATLAHDYWIAGETLRSLAARRNATLHRVRRDLAVARSLLVVAMSGEQDVPPELARAAIDARRGPEGPS